MKLKNKPILSIVFLLIFIGGIASMPTTSPTIQNLPLTNLGALATTNILWNTTSNFNNYVSNNCTIESGQLSLKKVNIAYDFTDDSTGADPSGWLIFEYPNTNVEVINDLDGHNKVVKVYDNASNGSPWMTEYFDSQTSGKVEFWLQTTSGWSDRIFVYLGVTNGYPDNTGLGEWAFTFDIRDNGEVWFWGPMNGEVIGNWTDDIWHHFLVDFNCTSREANVWIDGVSKGQYDFYTYFPYSYVHQLTIFPRDDLTGTFYIDAIDYSWTDGYFTNRSYSYYGQKYYNNCIWVSTVQDLGVDTPYYNNLTFSGQTNGNTSIYTSYRESQNGSSWSSWSAWSISNISFDENGERYFQVRILLATNDASQTPVLDWINFYYTT